MRTARPHSSKEIPFHSAFDELHENGITVLDLPSEIHAEFQNTGIGEKLWSEAGGANNSIS